MYAGHSRQRFQIAPLRIAVLLSLDDLIGHYVSACFVGATYRILGREARDVRSRSDVRRGTRVQPLASPWGDEKALGRVSVAETVGIDVSDDAKCWSEWQDLNLRPPRPERGALTDCPTLRQSQSRRRAPFQAVDFRRGSGGSGSVAAPVERERLQH